MTTAPCPPLMNTPEIVQFCCLSDNYCWLIHDPVTTQTAVIDTPDADEISRQLELRNWRLTHILTTHPHWDHVDGHLQLKQRYDCRVFGAQQDREQIPGIDHDLRHGDEIAIGEVSVTTLETPGHTAGHLSYWIPALSSVFVGDTLFSLGCGRLFDGTAEQLWHSIQQLRELPPETALYCAHEYSLSNARFARQLDPNNQALISRADQIAELRDAGLPTIPGSIDQERRTNPFMRADDPEIKERLQMSDRPAAEVFARLRTLKDNA